MTRLQKKCVVGAAGAHLLIIVVLFCSGFIKPSPKVDQTGVLTGISASDVEKVLNASAQNEPPPTPTPPQPPTPPTPPPIPQPPTPTVTPPPVPVPPPPIPHPIEPVRPVEPPPPDKTDIAPEVPKPKPPKPKVQVDLTVVHRTSQDADKAVQQQRLEAEREAKREAAKRQKAINDAMRNIENNGSTSTEVSVPHGNTSAAVENYGADVVSKYHAAWRPPANMSSKEVTVKFSVTIARDGTVVSSRITQRSGDESVDEAVQRMLDSVSFIKEFPPDISDSQKTFDIDFDASRTSLL